MKKENAGRSSRLLNSELQVWMKKVETLGKKPASKKRAEHPTNTDFIRNLANRYNCRLCSTDILLFTE
jgi:hypothetical protein